MCHPKTLFLVHNDQTQILEFHIFGQDTMGTNDNIGKAEQRRERVAEHLALVEAFSKDPFVKSIVEIFHGTVDEGSVRAADGAELPPGSKRRTRR